MIDEDRAQVERALASLRRDDVTPPEDARRAAVAVLLRGESLDAAETLLMRRAEREGDRWSGQIGFPGGHAEPGDVDLIATARRESREEVGVDPGGAEATVFGTMPTFQARARGARIPLYITPVVFHRPHPEAPRLGPEAAEAFWLPLARVRSGELNRPFRYEHGGVVHRLPSYMFDDRTIWGMTQGIIARLVDALAASGD